MKNEVTLEAIVSFKYTEYQGDNYTVIFLPLRAPVKKGALFFTAVGYNELAEKMKQFKVNDIVLVRGLLYSRQKSRNPQMKVFEIKKIGIWNPGKEEQEEKRQEVKQGKKREKTKKEEKKKQEFDTVEINIDDDVPF